MESWPTRWGWERRCRPFRFCPTWRSRKTTGDRSLSFRQRPRFTTGSRKSPSFVLASGSCRIGAARATGRNSGSTGVRSECIGATRSFTSVSPVTKLSRRTRNSFIASNGSTLSLTRRRPSRTAARQGGVHCSNFRAVTVCSSRVRRCRTSCRNSFPKRNKKSWD